MEDAVNKSATVAEILETSGLFYTHLNVETPPNKKLAKNDPDWILPKGVFQRNAALTWLRFVIFLCFRGCLLSPSEVIYIVAS